MEATNVQSSKSTNEVPNLEEAHDENKEGGSKVEKDKRKRKTTDEPTSKNPEPRDEECNSTISKIRNEVRYVCASPGRIDKFRSCIKEDRLQDKSIVQLDVPTRWNSTYLMLKSALKFQKAFKRLGGKCVEYVMLQGGNVKNMNMLIFVALVLDPRNKFQFVEWGMNKIYEKDIVEFMSQEVKEELYEMFEKYSFFANQEQIETCVQSSNENRTINIDSVNDELAVEFEKNMDLRENLNKNEIDLYLIKALEKKRNPNFDILNWWKVNSTKYHILGQLARDVLAIPMFTVASESAFSTRGRVLNCYRSSLTPKTVEALICTQNWCRSSPISTDVEELMEDLEKLELDLAPIPQLNEE
ncbi:hypothetical protein F3Y22_tig00111633pilonHSYRG00080 [Hibiscus syriacus]|uniref:HAT C-terminal dimerisation domain-containing protein n=1 Tax=Hibiscus syriacus TaxID=106335 RepID=A0A6A2Y539_HIBSY|nr:hypothetical protein F3Y22_tig00111633pilonHSYRG00080 [Hibiscus syriacus]